MRLLKFSPVIVAVLLSGGCLATQSDVLMQQQSVLELTRRLDNAERSLQALQQETAGALKTRVDALAGSQAELQSAVDGLRVDVQGQAGRFDDLDRADKTVRQDLSLVKDELSLQLADLAQRLSKVEQAQAVAPAVPAEDLYDRALKTIRDQQDPVLGREQMETFLRNQPSDPRAANALYWIGETFYAEKAYERAIVQFEEVARRYGDNPKAAAALFKQALAFDALNDRKSARVVLRKLNERFPLSEEAGKAKEKLKEWGP